MMKKWLLLVKLHEVLIWRSSGVISIWNLEKRRLQSVIRDAHVSSVISLHFFANERMLMRTSADNSIMMWIFDTTDGDPRLLKFRSGHTIDERRLVEVMESNAIKVWNIDGDTDKQRKRAWIWKRKWEDSYLEEEKRGYSYQIIKIIFIFCKLFREFLRNKICYKFCYGITPTDLTTEIRPWILLWNYGYGFCYDNHDHGFYYGSLTTEIATESLLRILQGKDGYGFYNGSLSTDFATELFFPIEIATELATDKEPWNLLWTNSYGNRCGVLPMEFATEYIGYGIKSIANLLRN
ncbi:hypothetical protein LXL04_012763 [Taraxacum kok-saghyz]